MDAVKKRFPKPQAGASGGVDAGESSSCCCFTTIIACVQIQKAIRCFPRPLRRLVDESFFDLCTEVPRSIFRLLRRAGHTLVARSTCEQLCFNTTSTFDMFRVSSNDAISCQEEGRFFPRSRKPRQRMTFGRRPRAQVRPPFPLGPTSAA